MERHPCQFDLPAVTVDSGMDVVQLSRMGLPVVYRPHPYVVPLSAGEHRICSCDESLELPLCDDEGGSACDKAWKITLESDRTVAICACGGTEKAPFCDGRHGDEKRGKRAKQ